MLRLSTPRPPLPPDPTGSVRLALLRRRLRKAAGGFAAAVAVLFWLYHRNWLSTDPYGDGGILLALPLEPTGLDIYVAVLGTLFVLAVRLWTLELSSPVIDRWLIPRVRPRLAGLTAEERAAALEALRGAGLAEDGEPLAAELRAIAEPLLSGEHEPAPT